MTEGDYLLEEMAVFTALKINKGVITQIPTHLSVIFKPKAPS